MNGTKQLFRISAAVEALTGLVAIASPSLLVWLLFSIPLTIGGEIIGRVAGIALLSLALACWPSSELRSEIVPLQGLLLYNGLVAVLFGVVALHGQLFGVLFWPAFLFHATITALLVLAWRRIRRTALSA